MQARFDELIRPGRVAAIAALALGTVLAGCSSDRLFGTSSSSSAPPAPDPSATAANPSSSAGGGNRSVAGNIGDMFLGSSGGGKVITTAKGAGAADIECPGVDIRTGAATLTLPPGGDAMALRYQGTINEMARSCQIVGSNMIMKVGVQGRIILGPAGGPGKIELPMRFAVVHEGPEPKTVATKFYKVPVAIPEGQANIPFTQVDDGIAFPVPASIADLDFYIVYVGFDPVGDTPAKKPAAKPAAKPAPRRTG
jgi:hypothetical protein